MSEPERGVPLKMPLPLERWHAYQGQSNDCGPCSVAIAANALLGQAAVDPQALAREMDARGLPERIPGWVMFPWALVAAFRRMGLSARWRVGVREARLWRNLHAGAVTVVVVGQPLRFKGRRWEGWSHYKVLHAWDPERGWGFIDPARRVGDSAWQAALEFRRQWTLMGRQIIELRGNPPDGIG